MGKYHKVLLMLMTVDVDDGRRRSDHLCPHHHQWFGQKTDDRTSNQNYIAKNSSNQLKTALGSQETAQNGSKWLKTAQNGSKRLKIRNFFPGESKNSISKNLKKKILKKTIEARTFCMISLDPELLLQFVLLMST